MPQNFTVLQNVTTQLNIKLLVDNVLDLTILITILHFILFNFNFGYCNFPVQRSSLKNIQKYSGYVVIPILQATNLRFCTYHMYTFTFSFKAKNLCNK